MLRANSNAPPITAQLDLALRVAVTATETQLNLSRACVSQPTWPPTSRLLPAPAQPPLHTHRATRSHLRRVIDTPCSSVTRFVSCELLILYRQQQRQQQQQTRQNVAQSCRLSQASVWAPLQSVGRDVQPSLIGHLFAWAGDHCAAGTVGLVEWPASRCRMTSAKLLLLLSSS